LRSRASSSQASLFERYIRSAPSGSTRSWRRDRRY
jgi:hypothetical protein